MGAAKPANKPSFFVEVKLRLTPSKGGVGFFTENIKKDRDKKKIEKKKMEKKKDREKKDGEKKR